MFSFTMLILLEFYWDNWLFCNRLSTVWAVIDMLAFLNEALAAHVWVASIKVIKKKKAEQKSWQFVPHVWNDSSDSRGSCWLQSAIEGNGSLLAWCFWPLYLYLYLSFTSFRAMCFRMQSSTRPLQSQRRRMAWMAKRMWRLSYLLSIHSCTHAVFIVNL